MILIVIDYACIVLFFVLLAALVLVMARQKPAITQKKARAQAANQHIPSSNKVAYGLLAALFVLLLAATWLSERGNPRVHASK